MTNWRDEFRKEFPNMLVVTKVTDDKYYEFDFIQAKLESFIEQLLEKQKEEILNIVYKECDVLLDQDKMFKHIDTAIIQFRDGLFAHYGLNPKEGQEGIENLLKERTEEVIKVWESYDNTLYCKRDFNIIRKTFGLNPKEGE